VESFFKTFKLEEGGLDTYADLDEARDAFAGYFELYNSMRLHSSLGMKTPDQFSKDHAILKRPTGV
jgi:transposase InsO family protein